MRRFTDNAGNGWDIVLGRESWGTLVALFVPERSSDRARQAQMDASGYDAAAKIIDESDNAALQALLDRSTVKDEA
jgi:hypothetical protein